MERAGIPTPPLNSRLCAESYRYGKNNRYSLKELADNRALFFDFVTGRSQIIGEFSGTINREFAESIKKEQELKKKLQEETARKALAIYSNSQSKGCSKYLKNKNIEELDA